MAERDVDPRLLGRVESAVRNEGLDTFYKDSHSRSRDSSEIPTVTALKHKKGQKVSVFRSKPSEAGGEPRGAYFPYASTIDAGIAKESAERR